MVPAPSCPYSWDYWTTSPSYFVDLTCLLPNSLYIHIKLNWDATLHDVKEELWMKATRYPLFGMLHEMSDYVFQFVNSLAVLEEINDENKRLRDIKPTFGVLKIVERSMRPGEQFLNNQISHLIGKGLNEFDNLRSSEVNDFRTRTRYIAEESLVKRSKATPLERLRYQCPPRLAKSHLPPKTLVSRLNNHCFILSTKVADIDYSFTTNAPAMSTPQQHIEHILNKKVNCLTLRHSNQDNQRKYVLKVCGRQEYLLGEHPLIQFLYIQETLSRNDVPQVMIVNTDKLALSVNDSQYLVESRGRLASEPPSTIRRKLQQEEYLSSWSVEKNYTCIVQSVGGLNVDTNKQVEVVCQAGIFHGGKPICEPQKTTMATVSNEGVARWDQALTFPIKVLNIPRMARLCFVIYSTSEVYKSNKSKKGKKDTTKEDINKLAWVNTMIFDYKNLLRTEGVTLFMWTHVADETQDDNMLLHPLGTVVYNPNTDECAALQVRFSDYECSYQIMFPSPEKVKERAEFPENGSPEVVARLTRDLDTPLYKDPLYEMHELEKKHIWASRKYFRDTAPQLLPKLLQCVEWGEQADSASVVHMMSDWPMLPVESALELLDYAYADSSVRSFAVKCLSKISDEELLLYLLQLVQALKHESYLMCDLALFLLQRAFSNMTIGHYLFWHLRSEMHVSSVAIRFGLVLEAYCRGSQDHVETLMRQISCLDKLKWANFMARRKKEIAKARTATLSLLQEDHCKETLCKFVSPLNPSFVCKEVKPDKCKVMDSKMRPLLLEFENTEPCGPDIRIILKIGDDLRQDMFTLQMLRIMDRLWKNEGYDFRLNPYNCISMENAVGMIEVVDKAETVANIQKQHAIINAASTISKVNLFQWLRDHNRSEVDFNKAVEEFTMSCAGYCVATYVMGIADRHPDNIMVKQSGQLFHIDFGHFLGHFKQKFGFKRERVPFVLTHDFIYVINKGQRGIGVNEPLDFKIFREHCETAYKILRRHGHLILSLFSMMISTGLPELKSEKDLQYLRDTLVLDLSEEKALEHFRLKFTEAVKNSWTTSFNWAFHNFDKNN